MVVLKEFLLPIYVDVNVRKEVLERFEGEARILKNLNHPQIVRLADYFVEDHRAYLVLEHIDGLSLRETVIKNGPLPEAQVKGLAQQMCAILTYLHQQAPPVVHRDFTPENLILRNDGTLKLIDFNVARQVESTVTSSVVGKPAYLPPEQFRGTPVPQSDIYGMGATLAFLLTGKDPEPINVSHPRETMASVSKNMDELVARATAIEVRDRYQNCDEILNSLDYEISQQSAATENSSAEQQIEKASVESPHRLDEEIPHVATRSHQDKEDGVTLKEPECTAQLMPAADDNVAQVPSITAGATSQASSHDNPKRSARALRLLGKCAPIIAWLSVAVTSLSLVAPQTIFLMDPRADLHKLERDATTAESNADYWLAMKLYDECLRIDPNDAVAHAGKGIVFLYVEPTQDYSIPTDATDEFGKASALDPDNKFYAAYYAAGLFGQHRWAEAAPMFERTISAHGFSLPAMRNDLSWTILNPFVSELVRPYLTSCYEHIRDNKKNWTCRPEKPCPKMSQTGDREIFCFTQAHARAWQEPP